MVGARKIIVDLEDIQTPLKELLKQCNVIQVLAEGSEGHTKAGLAKNKVLLKAYRQNTRSKTNG